MTPCRERVDVLVPSRERPDALAVTLAGLEWDALLDAGGFAFWRDAPARDVECYDTVGL